MLAIEPDNEELRIQSLCALEILDTPHDARFDRLTRLAAAMFRVPIAVVSLVDRERQWFKANVGLDVSETPRSVAFCSHAIEQSGPMVVADALLDPRFVDNALVTAAPFIRFYAGQPIFTDDGYAIGTLCIIDVVPRQLDPAELVLLRDLAQMAQDEINKDAANRARLKAERALQVLNADLETHVRQRTADLAVKNQTLVREIKQRQQVELTLRQSEERIRTIIDTSFNAFVGIDADGRIVDWNPAAEHLFGWQRDEAMGHDFTTLLIPRAQRSAVEDKLQQVMAPQGQARKLRTELQVVNRQGQALVVEVSVSCFTIGGQRFLGALVHDISERTAVRRALEQKQQLLDAILESVDVGVVACDADGVLTMFNRAARQFHGADAAAVDCSEWSSHYSLFAADGKTVLAPEEIPLYRALRGERVTDIAMVIAPDQLKRRTLLASGRPLVSSSGERLGAVVAMKDITELADSQARLAQGKQRLRLITDNLPSLIGLINGDGNFEFLNSRAERFYGKQSGELIGLPARSIYSDAEYAQVRGYIDSAMRGERVAFEAATVYRGKPYYYQACYVPNFDARGEPDGFFAMAFDITARKHSEMLQAESEERLRLVTDNLPALISYLDRDLRFTFANARYAEWLGKSPAAMIGRTVEEVFGAAFYAQRKEAIEQCLSGRASKGETSTVAGGEERTYTSSYIPHKRDGQVVGVYVLTLDTTAAHRHEKQLSELAYTDFMTGLPNRRQYEERLVEAVSKAKRSKHAMALLFLDIDRFKRINDTLGHAAGDQVLKQFGERLLHCVRQHDTVSRLAGDEFTIILESVASTAMAAQVAGKILAAMQAPFSVNGRPVNVTTSIGVAWSAAPCDLAMARLADGALYQSKQAGRNTFTMAEGAD